MRWQSPHGTVAAPGMSLTERLFVALETDPGRTVFIDGPTGAPMSAGTLMRRIRAYAGGLEAAGLGGGHTVALMAPNSPDFAAVFHAILWAGGTATTVNPLFTAPELHRQLADSGAEALITVASSLEAARAAVEGTKVRAIFSIDSGEGVAPLSALDGHERMAQAPVDLARHVAALPYSSGTTGLAKGVMLSHANLAVNLEQSLRVLEIEPGEVTAGVLPFFHIYALTVLMNVVPAGGGTVLTMPRFDLGAFLQAIETHRMRTLFIVPPIALALARHPLVDRHDLSSLEYVVSAAAPLSPEIAEAVGRRLNCVACQGYGMTELSPVSHLTPRAAPRRGSSGLAIPGTECRVVDTETGADLGPDETGELWVKGPQVMLGYLNAPAATAAAIVGDGWLRTGDLAAIDADGYLYVHDRVKELIKVKGFQVAPAEVEAALTEMEGIADAAVLGMPDEEAGERPVAFIVTTDPAPGDAAIAAHLEGCLARYKHPARILRIDAIPRSAPGKILRKVLAERLEAPAAAG